MRRIYRIPRSSSGTSGRLSAVIGVLMVLLYIVIDRYLEYSDTVSKFSEARSAERKTNQQNEIMVNLVADSRLCDIARPPPMENLNKKELKSANNVMNFDIFGVKLYQTVQNVLQKAQEDNLTSEPADIQMVPCGSDLINFDRLLRDNKSHFDEEAKRSCVGSIAFSKTSVSLEVTFTENYPHQPGCMVATKIELMETLGRNSASYIAWKAALNRKYGKPPTIDNMWGLDGGPELKDNSSDLVSSLELSDTRFAEVASQAIQNSVEDDRPTTKPQL